jgi:hypothetical protein
LRFQNYYANVKNTTVYMPVITHDIAQSAVVAICSVIFTECNVFQTAALMYWCEKFYDFQEVS